MAGKAKQAEAPTDGPLISHAKLQQMYAAMLQCRLLSEQARGLRRADAAARSLAQCAGHEAIATACAIDLQSTDTVVLVPYGANLGLSIARLMRGGAAQEELVSEMYAAASRTPLPTATEQLNLATQRAVANRKAKNGNVVVVFARVEATVTPDWAATLTHAAAKKLPMIFVVENHRSTAIVAENGGDPGLGLKEQSKAVPRMTVDGGDVVAVYRVSHESLARVRRGDGPALIEGTIYRLSTQSKAKLQDPLTHMEQYLTVRKLFPAGWKDRLVKQYSAELARVIRAHAKD
jgi:pyruvate dehydrogenase E1 component alpha subunit